MGFCMTQDDQSPSGEERASLGEGKWSEKVLAKKSAMQARSPDSGLLPRGKALLLHYGYTGPHPGALIPAPV